MYYNNIDPNIKVPLNDSHPRFYPSVTSFMVGEQMIKFAYVSPLEYHPTCVKFEVKITTECQGLPFQNRSQVVVKFMSRYRADIYWFLADLGFAPTLYHIGEVPDWKWAIKVLQLHVELGEGHGLAFGSALMVVMAFVEMGEKVGIEQKLPKSAVHQVAKILNHLDSAGYIFSDLWLPNIISKHCTQHVKLIDFNWTGRFNHCSPTALEGIPSVQEKIKALKSTHKEPISIVCLLLSVASLLFCEKNLGLKSILP